MPDRGFWNRQRVFLTGHTGFKGAWLGSWLVRLGAEVHGFSRESETEPSLYNLLEGSSVSHSMIGDVRDRPALAQALDEADPTVVIHMAAQSLVRRGYIAPIETFETNVIGTVNLLEAVRFRNTLEAVLIITTDKVYKNLEDGRAFCEDDALGGHDPYSASKAAAEIVASSWRQSFYHARGIPLITARAGNVIGGGDWAPDRIVPDIVKAFTDHRAVILRNPHFSRPWEHVLDPLYGYLKYVEKAVADPRGVPPSLNFGPDPTDHMTVAELAEEMLRALNVTSGWRHENHAAELSEMKTLSLSPARAKETLGWRVLLPSREAIAWTAAWYEGWAAGGHPKKLCEKQISHYEDLL